MPSNNRNRILGRISLVVFAVAFLVGIFELLDPATHASGVIVVLMGAVGMLFSFVDKIACRILRIEVPFNVLLILNIFIFLATVPGEIFDAYYKLWWWDVLLHLFSGFGVAYIISQILKKILYADKKMLPHRWLVFITVLMSLGCAVVWETTEFTIDSIFQTNMQKFVPAEFLTNDAGSIRELPASQKDIGKYYSQPDGLRFALIDTMEDHIFFLAGTLIWACCNTLIVYGHKGKQTNDARSKIM